MPEIDNNIKEIKSRIDIVDLVGKYVELKPAGKNFTCRCPFHNEKTPSFSVSSELQMYKCFGCGKTGDVFSFLMDIEHIEFKDALEKLAKQAGIELRSDKKVHYINSLNTFATDVFHRNLFKNTEAKEYLKARGFKEEDVRKFKIGLATNTNQLLDLVRQKYKLTNNQLLNSGLFTLRNNQIHDKFKNRITFPIYDQHNSIIGFTARQIPSNTFGPKYLNTPETEIFKKGLNIYGLNWAKYSIKKENLCIVCEGTTDVMSAHRIGIEHIVAPLGTSMTKDQLLLIKHFTDQVLFIFDNDKAGQNALFKAFTICQELGITAYATNTDPYNDIDEICNKDPEEFKRRISAITDAFSYIVSRYIKDLSISNLSHRKKISTFVDSILSIVKEKETKEFYRQRAIEIVGEDIFKSDSQPKPIYTPYNSQKTTRKARLTNEEILLKIILENQEYLKSIDLENISNEAVKKILTKLDNGTISISQLHEKLDIDEKGLVEHITFTPGDYDRKDFDFIYKRIIKERYIGLRYEKRKQLGVAQEQGDGKLGEQLQHEIEELDKLIHRENENK